MNSRQIIFFLSLGLFLQTTLSCFPRCPCCYPESGLFGTYDCRDTSTLPEGCETAIAPCKRCECCALTTLENGAQIHEVIDYQCSAGAPSECTNHTVNECLDLNCPCCDETPIPHVEEYACGTLPPEGCSNDPDVLEECPCSCWYCLQLEPTLIFYDCATGMPDHLIDRCFPHEIQCIGDAAPDHASALLPETSGGQDISLLQSAPSSDLQCGDELTTQTYCMDNGGLPMTSFQTNVHSINGGACRVRASGSEGVEWDLPIGSFKVGTDVFQVACQCFDDDGELHGLMQQICIECDEDYYFYDSGCTDETNKCEAIDDCQKCNDALCCWHSDCTCKPYCSLTAPFAIATCEADPAEKCCDDLEPPSASDPCSTHNGDCESCDAAQCCYHTDCVCRNVCLDEHPKIWPIPAGQCDVGDPEPYCCEDENCGILRTDGDGSSYIGSDSITVRQPRITSSITGHLESGGVTYSCLAQDCDDYCMPSVSVETDKSQVVAATLECTCCGCGEDDDTPTPAPVDCCEEASADIAENGPCPNTVPEPCGADAALSDEYEKCYCCELAQQDFASGGCVCREDCICGGSSFPGGCHPDYLKCCGTGCDFEVDKRYSGSETIEGASSLAECCSKCQQAGDACSAWAWNGSNKCYMYQNAPSVVNRAGWFRGIPALTA